MSDGKVYAGDVGTVIVLDTEADLSAAVDVSIVARDPAKADVVWPGVVTDGTKVRYVVQVDDLALAGSWRLQARVELPTGTWLGETVKMPVHKPFS